MDIDINGLVIAHLEAQNKEITDNNIIEAKQVLMPGLIAAGALLQKHLIDHKETPDLSINLNKFLFNLKFEGRRFKHIESLNNRDIIADYVL